MIRKILVAYDGSKSAGRAFEFAMELAKPFNATVTVLAVARPSEPATMVESTAMLESAVEIYEKDFKKFREAAAETGIELETQVVAGHPAEQIVHFAHEEKMDMIVMGHRGKSIMERWLLGSVSKRVVSYAPCSVTIVR